MADASGWLPIVSQCHLFFFCSRYLPSVLCTYYCMKNDFKFAPKASRLNLRESARAARLPRFKYYATSTPIFQARFLLSKYKTQTNTFRGRRAISRVSSKIKTTDSHSFLLFRSLVFVLILFDGIISGCVGSCSTQIHTQMAYQTKQTIDNATTK